MFYKMVVAYDGTSYHGWQIQPQPECPTITSCMQLCFYRVFHKSIHLIGASRTDAGVHALGQVTTFSCDLPIASDVIQRAWSRSLPSDIVIRSLTSINPEFHPQKNVIQKTYYYHIAFKQPLPYAARYVFYYRFPLDIKKFLECLEQCIGTHDFKLLCAGDERENTIRTVDSIYLEYVPRFFVYRIVVKGKSFLRYMIRRIIGMSLAIASSPDGHPAAMREVLEGKNILQHCATAPAHGLVLRNIRYSLSQER